MGKGIPQLTAGLCDQIASSTDFENPVWNTSHTVQILHAKAIGTSNQTRWRIAISDGAEVVQGIVATQLNPLLEESRAIKGSIVRVQRLRINPINDKRCVILKPTPDLLHKC
jgi:hypothetical protein